MQEIKEAVDNYFCIKRLYPFIIILITLPILIFRLSVESNPIIITGLFMLLILLVVAGAGHHLFKKKEKLKNCKHRKEICKLIKEKKKNSDNKKLKKFLRSDYTAIIATIISALINIAFIQLKTSETVQYITLFLSYVVTLLGILISKIFDFDTEITEFCEQES